MLSSYWKSIPAVLVISANILIGCSGGGGGTTMPATPQFTSTPVTAAEEGMTYTYQVTVTSSDMSAITYALSSGPMGATLSGNTITWTPTHTESRVPNTFKVTAMTAAGGSATQTWNVTPNGTVNITSVTTYWTPAGPVDIPRLWLPNLPYPAALVPQPDGSFQSLQGTQNPDTSFSISNVPAGYYWLELSPAALFWTSTSDFDDGQNVIGKLGAASTGQQTTTFDYAVSGLVPAPPGDYVTVKTDSENLSLVPVIFQPLGSATTINLHISVSSFADWSSVDTLYYLEYDFLNSGGFTGVVLGPELTVPNVSLVNGGTNNLTASLNPSPAASVALSIKGTQWANAMRGIGPGTPTPSFSDYAVEVQPYLTNGFVPVASDTPALGTFSLDGRAVRAGFLLCDCWIPGNSCGTPVRIAADCH